MQVLDKAFDVLMSEFGVIKRVYCEVCVHLNIADGENSSSN